MSCCGCCGCAVVDTVDVVAGGDVIIEVAPDIEPMGNKFCDWIKVCPAGILLAVPNCDADTVVVIPLPAITVSR